MIKQKKEYRPCVGIMLFNRQGHIFTGKRFDSDAYWQMPQGGVDDGEELAQAALRELLEEVGTDKVEIIAKSKDWINYDLPKEWIPAHWNGKYSGQKQIWFLMKFLGSDEDINVNYTDHPEFKEWCWQSIDDIVANAISFKKEVYKIVTKEFSSIIETATKSMIVDSHCHLIYFSDDEISEVMSRAERNDVKVLHNICVSLDDVPRLLKISSSHEAVYSSIGIHPLDATIERGECIEVEKLIELTKDQKVISIGETGLDFYKSDNKDNQKKSFLSHIEAARITELPLVIHTRNADNEIIDVLKSEIKKGDFDGVMHCFASSKELAYQAIDLGLYISFSGIITFKNANLLREIARDVPHEYVLVETDSPYLSPEPYRGKKNEPAMVKYVVDCLAKLWNKSPNEVAEITTDNFFKLFKNSSYRHSFT